MPTRSPSPDLLQLGRGVIRLALIVDGVRRPYRDLGNCDTLTVTTADTKLTKNSSRSGLATVYKEVTQERVVTVAIAGDEFDGDTLAAILQGEITDVAATAGDDVVDESIVLGGIGYGQVRVAHPLISAVTVKQAKTAAAAAVAGGGNTGDATVSSVTTPIGSVAQTITITATTTGGAGVGVASVVGSVSGALGSATVGTPFTSSQINFTLTHVATPLTEDDTYTVELTDSPVTHVVATDYTIVDATRGIIGLVEGGGIDPDFPLLVSYTWAAQAASRQIKGGTEQALEASIMFASDPAAGPSWDARFFRA